MATLLRCNVCLLRVHDVCYNTKSNDVSSWMCDRCKDNEIHKVILTFSFN